MYKSVVRDGKFLILVADGVFDNQLMELPTEELADKVAYELQSAWEQGISWGVHQKRKELNGSGVVEDISEVIQKLRTMSPAIKKFIITGLIGAMKEFKGSRKLEDGGTF
ncbi:hypothetical protein [Paenibacillus rigui]|uniref:Uncharacterized protein n=1 Tax=Paenibacillus rigui TaxID=554312 RepID=A0A229UX73_9BACL|nr:hypothetical protein [Paenibacillus rigui]OXM87529.1 hypothetical protein CF651_04155 [Paenibacillus rigui]